MKIYDVKKITNDLYAINEVDSVTLYLILGDKKALLLDTGYGYGDLASAIEELTHLPLDVALTHGHIDHILGNVYFEKVRMNFQDKEIMNEHITKERKNNLDYRLKKMPEIKSLIDYNEYLARDFDVVEVLPLDESIVFELGNRTIQVMELPGHSAGSVVFIDETNKMVFSGDSISYHNIWMFQEDSLSIGDYLASLEKIWSYVNNRKDETEWKIYPAHGRYPLTVQAIQELIKCCQEILANSVEKDEVFKMFGASGYKHYHGNVSVIYTKDRV